MRNQRAPLPMQEDVLPTEVATEVAKNEKVTRLIRVRGTKTDKCVFAGDRRDARGAGQGRGRLAEEDRHPGRGHAAAGLQARAHQVIHLMIHHTCYCEM